MRNHRAHHRRKLTELLDQVWQFELKEDPLLATDVGDPRNQDRLASATLQDFDRRQQARQAFLQELETMDPNSLDDAGKIDFELLRLRLSTRVVDQSFGLHLMPINNREGFHISLPELPREMNPKSVEDFRNYIARLRDLPRYCAEQITLMRKGIQRGLTQPAIILRDSVSQAEAHVVDDLTESLFFTNLNQDAIAKLPEETWRVLKADLSDAVLTCVVPAYRDFSLFLKNEYIPACRGSIAARALPQGRELYQSQSRSSPRSISQRTNCIKQEFKRMLGSVPEMEKIREQVGFEGDLPAFLEHLRTDPQFYPETAQQLLHHAAYILKVADGRLPDLFGKLPRIPYGLREIPSYVAPQTTSAYYWPPSSDGKRGGFYYLNTYNLSARPLYQLEALSLHEAVPGHHLQLALQAELEGLHPIRRRSNFTAFIEGWALYSEKLGKEIGFYKDPYQDFGRLSMEAWRASRLVVDTGIHAKGWTRQQAIDYMSANTALSQHNVVAEVDRYIGWPGQALGYKVGELFISDLRKEAESKLGEQFDIRDFHDMLLAAGSIPLPVLRERFDRYLEGSVKVDPNR